MLLDVSVPFSESDKPAAAPAAASDDLLLDAYSQAVIRATRRASSAVAHIQVRDPARGRGGHNIRQIASVKADGRQG